MSPPRGDSNNIHVPSARIPQVSVRIEELAKFSEICLKTLILFRIGRDLFIGMKDSGMVSAAEGLPDGRQRGGRLLADQKHRHLAWQDDVLVPALARHFLEADV